MDYIKIDIKISPFQDWLRDVLTAGLGEKGFESFMETENGFEAFIPEKSFNEKDVSLLLKKYEKSHTFSVKKELIGDRNWNEVWEKNYFKPLVIGGECLVRAPFHHDFPKSTYEIVIEPNMAFGTGNHETTSMMLEAILKENLSGKKVLDMGCGTGILGILASMKGAAEITAIDIDKWSVTGTIENTALNQVQNLKVFLGNAALLGNEKYDIIFANIHKNVLMNDIPVYSECMNTPGKLFISGFYTEDIPDLKARAESAGLKDAGFNTKNNWVAAFFLK